MIFHTEKGNCTPYTGSIVRQFNRGFITYRDNVLQWQSHGKT